MTGDNKASSRSWSFVGTTKKQVEREIRENECVALRLKGYNSTEIARQLGLGGAHDVSRHIGAALKRHRDDAGVDELREIEDRRLDKALVEAMKMMEQSEQDDIRLKAMDRIIRISERRSRLYGLDRPTQHDVTSDGQPLVGGEQTVVVYLPSNGRDEEGGGE